MCFGLKDDYAEEWDTNSDAMSYSENAYEALVRAEQVAVELGLGRKESKEGLKDILKALKDLESKGYAYEAADSQRQQARAVVNLAKYNLDVSIMEAPFDGMIRRTRTFVLG